MKLLNINKNFLKRSLLKIILLFGWVILVLYPNPGNLFTSVYRLQNPPVMPMQVSDLTIQLQLEGAPPAEIEQLVYRKLPYRYDWEVYNMPWYFPTLEETLQNGAGDCKARFLLFASILEELDIPYYKNISLTHVWVDYEGKPASILENQEEALFITDQNGQARFSMPRPDLERASQNFYNGFWEVMPTDKKVLLLSGFPLIFGIFPLSQTLLQKPRLPALPEINRRNKL